MTHAHLLLTPVRELPESMHLLAVASLVPLDGLTESWRKTKVTGAERPSIALWYSWHVLRGSKMGQLLRFSNVSFGMARDSILACWSRFHVKAKAHHVLQGFLQVQRRESDSLVLSLNLYVMSLSRIFRPSLLHSLEALPHMFHHQEIVNYGSKPN